MEDNNKLLKQDKHSAASADIWPTFGSHGALLSASDHASSGSPGSHPSHQRISIRREIPCTVLVNLGMSYAVVRKIHNLSLGGALVEMDAKGLQIGDLVELVLEFTYEGRVVEQRISAQVERMRQDRVALKFCGYDNRTYTELVNFLYTA